MTIEKRLSSRIDVNLKMRVLRRGDEVTSGVIQDLNIDGMAMRLDGEPLTRGSMVEAVFESTGRTWCLPALVIHSNGSYCGVMFADPQRELYERVKADEGLGLELDDSLVRG